MQIPSIKNFITSFETYHFEITKYLFDKYEKHTSFTSDVFYSSHNKISYSKNIQVPLPLFPHFLSIALSQFLDEGKSSTTSFLFKILQSLLLH